MISLVPILILFLAGLCSANTETFLVEVPFYFNIPPHPQPIPQAALTTRDVHNLNDTHAVLLDYPIGHTSNKDVFSNAIELIYNSKTAPSKTLLVRINNYGDDTYKSQDMLNIKLCWPATYPYSFDLSHKFLKTGELVPESGVLKSSLDLYVQIQYSFHAYTYDENFLSENEVLRFQLYINRLPNRWIPIPLELYSFIVYFVDLTILLVTVIPILVEQIFPTIK